MLETIVGILMIVLIVFMLVAQVRLFIADISLNKELKRITKEREAYIDNMIKEEGDK